MAKARVNRARQPNGRPREIPKAQQEQAAMSVALEAREKHYGAADVVVRIEGGGKRTIAANDPLWGSTIGRWYLWETITRTQLEALEEYARIRKAAMPHVTAQNLNPTSSGNVMSGGGRSLREDDEQRILDARRKESAMLAALRDNLTPEHWTTYTIKDLLDRLTLEDRDVPAGNARLAANVLAKHFRM